MPETFDRGTVKKRLENRIKELTAAQERLTRALEKLDSGAPLTDVWGELGPPPGNSRFNSGGPKPAGNIGERLDRLRAGKDGRPGERGADDRSDRPGERNGENDRRPRRPDMGGDMAPDAGGGFNPSGAGGEPLNPEEREKLFAFLQENMPAVAERFRKWQTLDRESFEIFLNRMAPRVREAGASLRRDPEGAKLRMVEVEKGLDVLDATQLLRGIYAAEQLDAPKLTEARTKLREALSVQMEARSAVHQHQISMLERQIQDLRKQAEEMASQKAERLNERAAAYEATIRERAAKHGDPKPEQRPDSRPERLPK